MTEQSSPPRYLPFLDGPARLDASTFRWRLGVRPLDLRDWIELGPDADEAIAAKARLSAQHHDTVFAVLDDVEPESSEVAAALVAHLRRRWPERYGGAELDGSLHPLDAAARLVPEDLVLLVERGGRLVFGGGSVCFPNRWDLRSKLGLSMAGVHAPVAQLNEQLEAPIDGFFDRLTPQRSFWRLGWGVLDTPDWYTPLDGTAGPRPADPRPEELFLRVERETLRRFPVTRCVLFTIRTYVTPIPQVAADPQVARRLADALDALPDDVRGYKDVRTTADRLIASLRGSSARS
ncbi:MAG: heme-dependent oxidative N-demethylase family protein [Acidobacteriota bacterium]